MKKMVLSVVACLALEAGAFVAWMNYHDVLCVFLFALALIPSCLFEVGRREWKGE